MGIGEHQVHWLAQHTDWAQEWYDKGRFAREQPQHTVTLPDYEIGRDPVTVGEFRIFVDAGGYQHRPYWTESGWAWRVDGPFTHPRAWDSPAWTGDDRLPVVGVCWYEACAYCSWLSDRTGQPYRLPTEAEWEKAARGTDGRLYPWGDRFEVARCNTRASGLQRTTLVGSYSQELHPGLVQGGDSPYGCTDMIGNVSEWTMSRFLPYPYHAQDGRDEPQGRLERVTRGGSWHSPDFRARVTARGMNDPGFRDEDLGFRCVRIL
jgi:formylglycine-generating enzyme required for sulfatase activity